MAIVPIETQHFEFLGNEQVQLILQVFDIKPPGQGEVFWRVLPHCQKEDVGKWK